MTDTDKGNGNAKNTTTRKRGKPIAFNVFLRRVAAKNGESVTDVGKRVRRYMRANNKKGTSLRKAWPTLAKHQHGAPYGDIPAAAQKVLLPVAKGRK